MANLNNLPNASASASQSAAPHTKTQGGKAPAKSIAPSGSQKLMKKKKKHSDISGMQYRSAVKKCLRESSPDGSIKLTDKTSTVLCGLANAFLEDLARQCADLAGKVHKETIGGDEIIYALELMLPGELAVHCIREVKNSIAKCHSKIPRNK
jgi:histone H3/H4